MGWRKGSAFNIREWAGRRKQQAVPNEKTATSERVGRHFHPVLLEHEDHAHEAHGVEGLAVNRDSVRGFVRRSLGSMTHDSWNPEALRALLHAYPPYAGAGVLVTHVAEDASEVRVEMPLTDRNVNLVLAMR